MTEGEAKEKWCPFDHWSATQNEGGEAPRCIGSQCMAWRWKLVPCRQGEIIAYDPKIESLVQVKARANGDGYCGIV